MELPIMIAMEILMELIVIVLWDILIVMENV